MKYYFRPCSSNKKERVILAPKTKLLHIIFKFSKVRCERLRARARVVLFQGRPLVYITLLPCCSVPSLFFPPPPLFFFFVSCSLCTKPTVAHHGFIGCWVCIFWVYRPKAVRHLWPYFICSCHCQNIPKQPHKGIYFINLTFVFIFL